MKQILFYDIETGIGQSTMKAPEGFIPTLDPSNPHIEVDVDLIIDAPNDWIVANDTLSQNIVITPDMVDAERDRRIEAGFTFSGKMIDFDQVSKENITGAGSTAGVAVAMGAAVGDLYWHGGTEPFRWITQDNTRLDLDAHQMFALSRAAADHVATHFFAGRTLKDYSTIPSSYVDDDFWP